MALTLSTKEALGEVGDLLDDADFIEAYCAAAILLGACFAWSPKNSDASSAVAVIRAMDVASDWPFGEGEELATAAQLIVDGIQESDANLAVEYQRLFVGPGHLAAPPWGSVYMDHDKVLYGCTWVELRDWMRAHGVESECDERFPSCSALTYCLGLDIISIYSQARHGARRIKGLRSWQRRRSATCKTCWA